MAANRLDPSGLDWIDRSWGWLPYYGGAAVEGVVGGADEMFYQPPKRTGQAIGDVINTLRNPRTPLTNSHIAGLNGGERSLGGAVFDIMLDGTSVIPVVAGVTNMAREASTARAAAGGVTTVTPGTWKGVAFSTQPADFNQNPTIRNGAELAAELWGLSEATTGPVSARARAMANAMEEGRLGAQFHTDARFKRMLEAMWQDANPGVPMPAAYANADAVFGHGFLHLRKNSDDLLRSGFHEGSHGLDWLSDGLRQAAGKPTTLGWYRTEVKARYYEDLLNDALGLPRRYGATPGDIRRGVITDLQQMGQPVPKLP